MTVELEDRITVATPEGLLLALQLAGVGSRFIAGVFDLFLQAIIIALVAVVANAVVGGSIAVAVLAVSVFLVIYFYDVLFEVLAAGRTPGKRLTHLRVVRDDGTPIDLPSSAIRNLLRLIDGPTFAYLPGLASVLVTRRNQRLGDLAAGTLVIRDAVAPAGPPPLIVATVADGGTPAAMTPSGGRPLDASAVTDAEMAAVRRFLARRDDLERTARQRLAYRLQAGLRPKVSGGPEDQNPERFLEALADAKARV
jgi:uncharacterized RDD family membrane protein YckC